VCYVDVKGRGMEWQKIQKTMGSGSLDSLENCLGFQIFVCNMKRKHIHSLLGGIGKLKEPFFKE